MHRFSADRQVHEATTSPLLWDDHSCWSARTLGLKGEDGRRRERVPKLVAGLIDHVWIWRE